MQRNRVLHETRCKMCVLRGPFVLRWLRLGCVWSAESSLLLLQFRIHFILRSIEFLCSSLGAREQCCLSRRRRASETVKCMSNNLIKWKKHIIMEVGNIGLGLVYCRSLSFATTAQLHRSTPFRVSYYYLSDCQYCVAPHNAVELLFCSVFILNTIEHAMLCALCTRVRWRW